MSNNKKLRNQNIILNYMNNIKGGQLSKLKLIDGPIGVNMPPEDKAELYLSSSISNHFLLMKGRGTPVGVGQGLVGGANTMEFTTADGKGDQATRVILRGNTSIADIECYMGASGSEAKTFHFEGGNGRLLIGSGSTTTSPSYNLHISSKADAAIFLEADVDNVTETHNAFIKFSQDGATKESILGIVGNSGFDPENVAYTDTDANATLLGILDAEPLQFGTNGAVRMTIDTAGKVGIGTTSPSTSAVLELSTTTGALLLSRMTTTQRNALTAVNGMFIYNSTLNKFQGYENGTWTNLI